jgi:choline-glycine betaine transporter
VSLRTLIRVVGAVFVVASLVWVLASSSPDSTNQGPLWVASFCVAAIALLALVLLLIGAVLERPFAKSRGVFSPSLPS